MKMTVIVLREIIKNWNSRKLKINKFQEILYFLNVPEIKEDIQILELKEMKKTYRNN